MDEKTLGELCNIVSGGTPSRSNVEFWENGTIPWIKIGNIKGKYVQAPDEFITQKGLDNSSAKMLPKGTVLYTIFATLGEVGILNIDACTNQAIAGLTIKDEKQLNTDYLYYYLMSKKTYVNTVGRGVAQNNINMSILRSFKLPLLPICEQKKIVKILDKVNDLRNGYQLVISSLDNLIRARFVEMFGDPKVNPFGWDMTLVRDVVASCEAGWSGNGTQREKEDGEIAVLKVSAVTKGYFIPEECKVLDDQDTIKKYVYPQAGDLLFSRANTREMVGATAVITQDYPEHILPDKLWKIRFLGKANVWYMKYVLSSESIRSIFSSVSTGTSGSMFNVSMDKFKSIRVPLPPIARQQQFASFVNQVNKSKVVHYIINRTLQTIGGETHENQF